MDCSSTSDADRACECGELAQWPNDKKPIFFIETSRERVPFDVVAYCSKHIANRHSRCYAVPVPAMVASMHACRDPRRPAFAIANRIGDIPYAAHACNSINSDPMFVGEPLPDAQAESTRGLAYMRILASPLAARCLRPSVAGLSGWSLRAVSEATRHPFISLPSPLPRPQAHRRTPTSKNLRKTARTDAPYARERITHRPQPPYARRHRA